MTVFTDNAALAAYDRETWERQHRNAATADVLARLDRDLTWLRFIAHIARRNGKRVDVAAAGARIVAAAASRLVEVGQR